MPFDQKTIYSLFISSDERTHGENTNFSVGMDDVFTNNNRYFIRAITVPYSYYNIRSGRNTLVLTAGIDGVLTVTIPSGNYTALSLATAIDVALNAAAATGTYTTTYDSSTYKYTITCVADTFQMTTANIAAGNLWNFVGFYVSNGALAASKTSDSAVRITGNNRLYVSSRALSQGNCYNTGPNTSSSKLFKSNVVSSILVDANPGGIIHDRKEFAGMIPLTQKIDRIDFQLLHEDGTQVDLNGSPWQIELLVGGY